MKIVMSLLFTCTLFCQNIFAQTFDSTINHPIENGCSDTIDVVLIDLSNEALPNIDGTQFGIFEVCIDISHTWLADIKVSLKNPMGTVVELTSDNGESGDNYTGTCFKMDGADGSITSGTPPMTGIFIPEGDLNELNDNSDPNGLWELIVCDDQVGFSGALNFWSITFEELEDPNSIAIVASNSINIFPNPFSTTLNIESDALIKSIRIFDSLGRLVQTCEEETNGAINLEGLNNGVYFIEILNENGTQDFHKVIKK